MTGCHVEAWRDDHGLWGWSCFTCPADSTPTHYGSLAAAEVAGERHATDAAHRRLLEQGGSA